MDIKEVFLPLSMLKNKKAFGSKTIVLNEKIEINYKDLLFLKNLCIYIV